MDVNDYKKEIEKVQLRYKQIEADLIRAKTMKDASLKELSENFGITEAEIPEKLESFKIELIKLESDLANKLKEMKEYIGKIEELLA